MSNISRLLPSCARALNTRITKLVDFPSEDKTEPHFEALSRLGTNAANMAMTTRWVVASVHPCLRRFVFCRLAF